ncbi:RNA 2',3'-cyclic phosphodiesterase [Botrimarina sp.]|uniref:RNA 2',3'-cyclic phosphodiesterase n=1 Tax=Botrimarina sp. TaxID=2795802 RepID=UPI0032F04A62
MAKTRTFVAIESGPDLQRRAEGVADRLRPYAPRARWVDPDDLHLTLLFLGDLDDREVAEACSAADWVAKANEPFSLRVHGVGAFPAPSRPRAIWLGVSDGRDAVCRLQADLDDAIGHLVQKRERRGYVPHWTLARMARGGPVPRLDAVLPSLAEHDAGVQAVDEIVVLASELHPEGPDYYALARCPLGAGG